MSPDIISRKKDCCQEKDGGVKTPGFRADIQKQRKEIPVGRMPPRKNVTYSPLTHLHLFGNLMDTRGEGMIEKNVGERIRSRRKQLNLSQEKLALKADVDRTYLAGVEQGKRNISIRNLEKILSALEISFADFFTGI